MAQILAESVARSEMSLVGTGSRCRCRRVKRCQAVALFGAEAKRHAGLRARPRAGPPDADLRSLYRSVCRRRRGLDVALGSELRRAIAVVSTVALALAFVAMFAAACTLGRRAPTKVLPFTVGSSDYRPRRSCSPGADAAALTELPLTELPLTALPLLVAAAAATSSSVRLSC